MMKKTYGSLLFLFGAAAAISWGARAGSTDWMSQVNGKGGGRQGPNCFSGALMQVTGKPEIRYVSSDELAFWLNPEHGRCNIVENAAAKQPGDIIVIYAGAIDGGTEDHAFTYVSKNRIFAKNGNKEDSKYIFQDPHAMLSLKDADGRLTYGFPASYWDENRCQTPDASSGCKRVARVFRCKQGGVSGATADDKRILSAADAIAKKFESLARAKNLSDYERSELADKVSAMQSDLEDEQGNLNAKGALYWRLESVKQFIQDYYYY